MKFQMPKLLIVACILFFVGMTGTLYTYNKHLKRTSPLTVRVVDVIDGDTIKVIYKGKVERVRLLRIDTPERGEPGFDEAAETLTKLLQGGVTYGDGMGIHSIGPGVPNTFPVRLEFEYDAEERDRYGRLLCYVWCRGRQVNRYMILFGHSTFVSTYGTGKYAEHLRLAQQKASERRAKAEADE